MSFLIATHTDTRWTVGCYTLAALSLALLSMVLPWVSLIFILLLGWSTWTEKQGHVGWFRNWIPKQHAKLMVHWSPDGGMDSKPNMVHFHMSTHQHWWIRTAGLIILLTMLCWLCVFMGWVTVTFAILPLIGIIGLIGHKAKPVNNDEAVSSASIEVYAPAETTWNGLLLFFEQHQSNLSTTGTLVVHSKPSSIPVHLPTGFEQWSINYNAA